MKKINTLMGIVGLVMCLSAIVTIISSPLMFSRILAVPTLILWGLVCFFNFKNAFKKGKPITLEINGNPTEATLRKMSTAASGLPFIEAAWYELPNKLVIKFEPDTPQEAILRMGQLFGTIEAQDRSLAIIEKELLGGPRNVKDN